MAEKIKLQFGTHTMIGEIEHAYLNTRYEEGKSFNYNRDNGGYTYHFTAIAVDTAEYIAVYMEIDSKSFKSCAKFISDDEHRALMEQRKKLLPKHKKVGLPDFGFGSDNET